ncbi:hypothetical protein PDESU_04839 [Pontiella desulfatans]|uniref:Uncharacterized protein n=1 Tax=Pontiella desulfatans TaxID=2750659 RepID=A0A6C2U824_PONDE|nr:hypothetical protein [Pontiella desulfatans]VGO16248.1 hypothetical protein PDESU_04839 [Pontiella desulfatans]
MSLKPVQYRWVLAALLSGMGWITHADARPPAELPGELTAEQILNGQYLWPASPEIKISRVNDKGFDPDAFGQVPAPGIHPRILFSPGDLPAIRKGVNDTDLGRKAYANLKQRNATARQESTAFSNVYTALLVGDAARVDELLGNYREAGADDGTSWHHRPNFEYILMLECFSALVDDDARKGQELAKAVTTLAQVYQQRLDAMDTAFLSGLGIPNSVNRDGNAMPANSELNSDVWRSGRRQAFGGEPWFAYMYDFAYNWMDAKQQSACRKAINTYIGGRTTMGSHMPHHFRNWNWVAVGAGLLLNAVATEGEEGHDLRVYEHTKEIQTDYVTYGWSQAGSSREAIGYTQFGLRWSGPAMVAMARRGHNLWNRQNWYNQLEWYAHAVQPGGGRFISHGDGGHDGPQILTPLMFKKAFPQDRLVDYVYRNALEEVNRGNDYVDGGRGYVMLQCLYAADPATEEEADAARAALGHTFFDPERGSLIANAGFGADEVQLQFECREDAFTANHQHADRGAFTLAGAGRVWGIEHFRGVESRHHNVVTIDYMGQGYFTPPGRWLGLVDDESATFGFCDAKHAYDGYWQTTVTGFADKNQPRRHYQRWAQYVDKTDTWLAENPDVDWQAHIDRTPQVEKYWAGFEAGDPRMWDEYSRPVHVPHNPVQKAFRSAGLVRGTHSYALVVDDIRKDDAPHTFDWNMMVDPDVELVSVKTDEILLGGDPARQTGSFTYNFDRKAEPGDPQLYIKVLERSLPENMFNNPQIRLETIEFKDARNWPDGRSFGLVKRLVVPSFSVEPKFKMLLFPHRQGDTLPEIAWNDARTQVSVEWADQKDVISFADGEDGRTRVKIVRDGKTITEL